MGTLSAYSVQIKRFKKVISVLNAVPDAKNVQVQILAQLVNQTLL